MVVWYADGLIGAAADSMEDEDLGEGWRRSGGAFSHPLTSVYFFRDDGFSKARWPPCTKLNPVLTKRLI
jgi:hypothetical protein